MNKPARCDLAEVSLSAHAKLTLTLRITGVRHDGYHLIRAEMVTIDITDMLHFGDGDSLHFNLEGPARNGLAVDPSPDNLVARALRHVGRSAAVQVVKRIPAGAGLGGGSADAAAVLRWAGRVSEEDVSGAADLGADVPFCVHGGRAEVTGIGEVVHPLPFMSASYTIGLAPFGVSTPAVYRKWDELGGPSSPSGNDLESAALAVEPRLASIRDDLGNASGRQPVLAGSGSSWFVPGEFPGPNRVVARTVDRLLSR